MSINSHIFRDLRWRVILLDRPAILRRVTALSVAVILSLSFAVLTIPLVWSICDLLRFPQNVAVAAMIALAAITAWVFSWSFERALHVERLIARGEDVDEASFSLRIPRRDTHKPRPQ
jgi:predicted ATPase